MRKFFLLTLILTLTVSINVFCTSVYADSSMQGEGTEENPYLVYTAADMFNVNNDVNACYKLMSDIDLDKQEFAPIGNASAGTFAGTFDGNGYTISNLKVSSGKYAALFGCNEGTIKNIILKNIDVSGTRYVAGVVAENAETGTVENCKVLSGKVQGSDGLNPLNIGGICGLNGGKMNGSFENRASVKSTELSSVAGGIVGKSTSDIELSDVRNSGDITGDCAGGIVGHGANVDITGGQNAGNISNFLISGYESYGGGNNKVTFNSVTYGCAGGILGYCIKAGIKESYNAGKIAGVKCGAGIIARTKEVELNECYNSAVVDMLTKYDGTYDVIPVSKGLTSQSIHDATIIKNSYNSGNLHEFNSSLGGPRTPILSYGNVFNCYDTGIEKGHDVPRMQGENSYMICRPDSLGYTESEMRMQDTFVGWEFDTTWTMDEQKNSGYPTLLCDANPLQLNYSNKIICEGETLQLIAYKDKQITDNVKWIVSDGNASVSDKGLIAAGSLGLSTITAVDEEGNKANCNIYVVEKSENVTLKYDSYNYNYIYNDGCWRSNSLYFSGVGTNDYVVDVKSDNESIIKMKDSYWNFYTMGVGKANITVEFASGVIKTFPVTVTNYATSVAIKNAPSRIECGKQYQLGLSTSPNPTSSKITWESSDETIATVSNTGLVTTKKCGNVKITVKTDNWLSTSCNISVVTAATSLSFEKKVVELYVGESEQLDLTVLPVDTTDSVTYTSDYTSIAKVSNTGKVTAVKLGTAIISAKATGGVIAECTVKVIDYPTIVTDVTLDQTEYDMKTGEVFKLNATIVPSDATDRSITWATTDDSVASVSQVGTVTAVGAGKAVITATSGNGVIGSCEVTVTGVASTNISRIYIPEIFDSKNDIVDVPVMIENNPGVSFIECTISYDKEKMSPIQISNGSLFDSVMGSIDEEKGRIKLILSSKSEVSKNGAFAEIEFERKNKDEEIATLSVSYYPSKVLNASNEMVMLNITDGLLNSYHSTISGDVDENRTVDFVDALYLSRYLAKWSGYQDVREENADLNAEDGITAADLMILERYLAGWSEAKNYNIGYSA